MLHLRFKPVVVKKSHCRLYIDLCSLGHSFHGNSSIREFQYFNNRSADWPTLLHLQLSLFHSHWHTQVTLPPPQSVSPRVHLQPGLQLSSFRSIHSCQDVPTVYVDDLHRQVTHLTCLIQRLQRGRRTVIFWIGIVLMGLGLNGLPTCRFNN